MEDRWARLEEIVRRVVKEELAAWTPKKQKNKVGFKAGSFTGLGDIEIAALEAAYPAVNVRSEIKRAAAWIVMHPKDAPASNFGAYLNTWMRREQDRSSIRAIPTQSERKRICAWCQNPSTGSTNGYEHCQRHGNDALYGAPPSKVA